MHRTLKAETTRPPAANARAQQRVFDRFRHEYNEERPHEALGDETPASRWRPSRRPYPEPIEKPEYPGHFLVRLVSNAGCFRWHARQIFVSHALAQQWISGSASRRPTTASGRSTSTTCYSHFWMKGLSN
jgi:hypothetical protein